jgi:hypothetical protein
MNLQRNLRTSERRSFVAGFTALAVSLGLAGCASMSAPEAPELAVRTLATQRWQALLAQDFNKAYTFVVPSYRQLNTADAYQKKRQGVPVKWISAKVLRVECGGQKCDVRIELESKPLVPFAFNGTITSGIDETWVLENGRWWMLETL